MYPKKANYAEVKPYKKTAMNASKAPINPFNKTASTKQIVYQNRASPIRKQVDVRQRLGSRSIQFQDSYQTKSDMRSQQLYEHQNEQQVQLFGKSNRKLAAIKDLFGSNKTMELELCEVLKLIKEEKNKIYETITDLKDVSDYYKNLAQSKQVHRVQTASNTEDMLPLGLDVLAVQTSMQTDLEVIRESKAQAAQDQQQEIQISHNELLSQQGQFQICGRVQVAVQVQIQPQNNVKKWGNQDPATNQLSEEHQSSSQKESEHASEIILANQKQTYQKLGKMLSDMNIDYKNILPEGVRIDTPVKDWKNLSEGEVIKIQKYFIKKLAQKIQN